MTQISRAVGAVLLVAFLAACASKSKQASESTANGDSGNTKASAEATGKGKSKKSAGTSEAQSSGGEGMPTGKVLSELQCSNSADNRTLAIFERGQSGCDLVYTKFGEGKSIANSEVNAGFCEEVRNRIKGNLETAGFSCQ